MLRSWVSVVRFLAFLSMFYILIVVEFIGENLQGGLDLILAVRDFSKGSHDAILIGIIALGVRPQGTIDIATTGTSTSQ